MQLRFQNHPEFMVECSLFDIIPPDTVSVEKLQQLQSFSVTGVLSLHVHV